MFRSSIILLVSNFPPGVDLNKSVYYYLICNANSLLLSPRNRRYLSPLVEQELLTLPEHLSSLPVFSWVRVTRSLVLYVCFVDRFLSFFFWSLCCLFFFDIRILITSLISSNSSAVVSCIWFIYVLVYSERVLFI